MLHFGLGNNVFRRAGLGLQLASFFIFIFALPPLQDGIWLQVEPIVYALWVWATLGALWCLFGVNSGKLVIKPLNPLWMVTLAWLGWQFLAGVYSDNAWRSWFGSPEIGEGLAWHIALLVMIWVACPLWQVARYRRLMLAAAIISILIQSLLYLAFPLGANGRYVVGSWRPSTWADYMAFMSGYVWVAWAMVSDKKSVVSSVSMTLFMLATLVLSNNSSATVLLGSAVVVSWLVIYASRYRTLCRFFMPSKRWRCVAVAACIASLGWTLFSGFFPVIEPHTRQVHMLAMLSEKDGSLGSRIMLNQMGLEAMRYEPKRWLVGNGWGGFADITFNYALAGNGHVFKEGKRQPDNLMVDGYSFHSHNQPLEALLSLGLPGLLLWFLVPLVAIALVPKRCFWLVVPMQVGLVWEASMWFELAQCLPFKALALAAFASVASAKQWLPKIRWVTMMLCCVAVAMAWSAWQQKKSIRYAMQLRAAAHVLPYDDFTQSWVEQDIRLGGDRLRSSAVFFTNWLILKKQGFGLDDNDQGWYGRFIEAAHNASKSPLAGSSLAALELKLYYTALLDLNDNGFRPLHELMIGNMPAVVLQLARRAPLRDDMATAYLQTLVGNMSEEAMANLQDLLIIVPNHRGALWVMGKHLRMVAGRENEGLDMQKRAVAMGVERIYPLSEDELAAFK